MKNNLFVLRVMVCAGLVACSSGIRAQEQNTIYKYEYDAQGNLIRIIDPLNRVTDRKYDALNRMVQQVQPAPAAGAARPTIAYRYDGLDQLVSVTDPRNLTTNYTIDGLGNQTQLASSDTGTTVKTHDAAGNVLTSRDAKGQLTRYDYDALNRITKITYHDGNVVNYIYDIGHYALGHLSTVSDANDAINYEYDQRGRVITETRTLNSSGNRVAYITRYGYDSAGRLMSMTYPSGRVLSYTRDALGRISQIDTTKDGNSRTLVTEVVYHPFGGVKSFKNGAGQVIIRGMDLDGRINSYTLGSQSYSVGYDAASRIKYLTDRANPNNIQNFNYDDLDHLTGYNGTGGTQSLGYDLVGNRTSKLIGTSNTGYNYGNASNRLLQVVGAQNTIYQIDPNGSITSNGANQFHYDARGRMISAETALGTVTYTINALGQRIAKTVRGTTTVFHYDSAGKLIAESADSGAVQKEYVYLHDLPVALLQ